MAGPLTFLGRFALHISVKLLHPSATFSATQPAHPMLRPAVPDSLSPPTRKASCPDAHKIRFLSLGGGASAGHWKTLSERKSCLFLVCSLYCVFYLLSFSWPFVCRYEFRMINMSFLRCLSLPTFMGSFSAISFSSAIVRTRAMHNSSLFYR